MKRPFTAFTLMSICFFAARSGSGDTGTSVLQPIPQSILPNELLRLNPVKNHHINVKAPRSCGRGTEVKFNARTMQCQFETSGTYDIKLGICDEAETYCRVETASVVVAGVSSLKQLKPTSKQILPASPKFAAKKVTGFITNDAEHAIRLAKKTKRLVLIDFYGAWCPPCNELEEYVFETTEFQNATKDVVKLRIDADTSLSWKWRDKFRIRGLPTLLIATPQMDEVGRLVGYRPLPAVLKWLAAQKALKAKPIAWALRQKTPAARLRLAQWHLDRGEEELALKNVEGLDDEQAKLLRLLATARVQSDNQDKHYAATLEQLIQSFPGDIRVGDWVTQLFGESPELAKKYAEQALKTLERWRASPELATAAVDYDVADLYMVEGDIYDGLKDATKKKESYSKAADFLEGLTKNSALTLAKGSNMRRGYALREAGRLDEANALYKLLATTYADEYPFNYNYARVLQETKKYDEALIYVSKAEEQGYGDNWLKAVELKARLLKELGRKDEAKTTIQTALNDVVLPKSTAVWSNHRVGELHKLLGELEKN